MTRARRWLARGWGALPLVAVVALLATRAALAVAPGDRLAPSPPRDGDPPGAVAREGSVHLARGGPYVVGFDSPGPARLTIGGQEVAGAGRQARRVLLDHGVAPLRFAAPPGARLRWSPPGRRGDLESVPASALSPRPPAEATFGADAGAAPADGLIALGLLATLAATACGLARRRLAAVPRRTWLGMAAVLAVALAARWIDLGGAGQTWDEDVNWASARELTTNVLALDARQASWLPNFQHPPVLKYLAGPGALLADGYGPARALSALWVALGCALLVPIGARLWRPRVGVLAGLVAALLPPLVAHGKVVGHEAPTVLWWTLAIVLALGVHDELPGDPAGPRRRLLARLAAVGAVLGVACASRFVNALLGPLALVVIGAAAPTAAARRRALAWGAAVLPAVAVLAFVALWPRMWSEPLRHLGESWRKLAQPHGAEPFLGAMTSAPGPHYFVVYLLATLPLGALVAAVVGAARLARRPGRAALVAAAWLVVPLGVAASPVRQDGVRYVMPSVVALAVLAAVGVDAAAAWLEARRARPGRAFAGLAAALVGYLAVVDARVHPYYLDYFGEHVGGAAGVAARRWFEVGWWGEGLDRAVAHVNARAARGDRVYRGCVEPAHLAWFREDLWAPMAQAPGEATWIVAYQPAARPCPVPPGAVRELAVRAGGAVIAEVYRVPPPAR